MVYAALFITVALLEIFAAVFIFVFKDILHVVLSVSALFAFNSAMFFILSQPLLALLQLFIMVGGISTYIFVGVSSPGYSKFRSTNYLVFGIVYMLFLFVFTVKIAQVSPLSLQQNVLSGSIIANSITANYGVLYLLAVMLFGTGFGSILLMKKLGGDK